jgi:hypothetical protein
MAVELRGGRGHGRTRDLRRQTLYDHAGIDNTGNGSVAGNGI